MTLTSEDLHPGRVVPINVPNDAALLARLVEDMRLNGWGDHRRLLVEEAPFTLHYFAWTGSHRVEAARRAGLATIPCRVLSRSIAVKAFESAGYVLDTYQCWRDALGGGGIRQEKRRLEALKKAGLADAALMLEEEFAATDGHR